MYPEGVKYSSDIVSGVALFYQLEETAVGSAPIIVRQQELLVFRVSFLGGDNRAVGGRHKIRLVARRVAVFALSELEGEVVKGDVFIPTMTHDAYAAVRKGES